MAKQNPPQVAARVNYLRVSDEDGQYPERSYDYQRQLIEDRLGPLIGMEASHEYRDIQRGTRNDRAQYQQMLADARAGLFSDLCVYHIDRFGRSPQEVFTAVNMLQSLGVRIWVADMPNMEIGTPTGNLQLGIQAVLARYEIDLLGQRVRDTKRQLMLQGKWPNHPPEGYVSMHEDISSRKRRCWIEQDPTQAKMIRDAYDLWLTGDYTMKQLCEELHKLGYTRKSGKPWAWDNPGTGTRQHALSHIQRILNNPFYAGWVTSERHGIERGQVRGEWEPIITDEEHDRGLAILRRHDTDRSQERTHQYLLLSVLYLDCDGRRVRLYGSTPTGRSKSYSYYRTQPVFSGKRRRVSRDKVELGVPEWLRHITICPEKIPEIRRMYHEHIDRLSTPGRKRILEELAARIKALENQEADLGRLLLTGKLSEDAYDRLRREWREKLMSARLEYNTLSRDAADCLDDLEIALKVLGQADWIFGRLTFEQQRKFIRLLTRKIVINLSGEIIDWELNSPFEYLSSLAAGRLDTLPASGDQIEARTSEHLSSMMRSDGWGSLQGLPQDMLQGLPD